MSLTSGLRQVPPFPTTTWTDGAKDPRSPEGQSAKPWAWLSLNSTSAPHPARIATMPMHIPDMTGRTQRTRRQGAERSEVGARGWECLGVRRRCYRLLYTTAERMADCWPISAMLN